MGLKVRRNKWFRTLPHVRIELVRKTSTGFCRYGCQHFPHPLGVNNLQCMLRCNETMLIAIVNFHP